MGRIFKDIFLYIIPLSAILFVITLGEWKTSFITTEGTVQNGSASGFPFPSEGYFWGAMYYASSGDISVSPVNLWLDRITCLLLAALLYYLVLKKIKLRGQAWEILQIGTITLSYVFLAIIFFFGRLFGHDYDFPAEYHLQSYHLWWQFW